MSARQPLVLNGEIDSITVSGARPNIGFNQGPQHVRHFEGRSLFIGDLAPDVDETDIWNLFQQAGEIHAVDIKRDKQTGANRGYGFVVFKKPDDAMDAKNWFQNSSIKGRTIRLGWAQKNAKLFVALLPKEVSPELLASLVRQYGPLNESQTEISEHGFGFVEFRHRCDAEKARLMMDTGCLHFRLKDGRSVALKIRVGWADDQTQRNCVHVHFDAAKATETQMTAIDLREQFSVFGCVVKASTPKHPNCFLKGYGFVHFPETVDGEVCTANAILALDGTEIRGITWTCNFGKRKKERQWTKPPLKIRDQHQEVAQHRVRQQPQIHMPVQRQVNSMFDPYEFIAHDPRFVQGLVGQAFVNSSPLWHPHIININRSPSPFGTIAPQFQPCSSPALLPYVQPFPISAVPRVPSPGSARPRGLCPESIERPLSPFW